jgi:hypothetical protein
MAATLTAPFKARFLIPDRIRKKSRPADANVVMAQRTSRPADADADLVAWRRSRLQRAGFPEPLARELAADRRTDLHAVLDLVDRGCPPVLAARILAPLDPDGGPGR